VQPEWWGGAERQCLQLRKLGLPVCGEDRRDLAFGIAKAKDRGLRSATDTVTLPKPEPRAIGLLLVVPAIRSRDIAGAQRPAVWDREDALQPLDFGNGLLDVHARTSIANNWTMLPTVVGREFDFNGGSHTR